jgi:hypothetical protein
MNQTFIVTFQLRTDCKKTLSADDVKNWTLEQFEGCDCDNSPRVGEVSNVVPLEVPSGSPHVAQGTAMHEAIGRECSQDQNGPPYEAVRGAAPDYTKLEVAELYRTSHVHTAALRVVEAMDVDAREIKVPGVLALALLNLRSVVKHEGAFEEKVADVLARKCDELQAENKRLHDALVGT